jgi:TctA family transporter
MFKNYSKYLSYFFVLFLLLIIVPALFRLFFAFIPLIILVILYRLIFKSSKQEPLRTENSNDPLEQKTGKTITVEGKIKD